MNHPSFYFNLLTCKSSCGEFQLSFKLGHCCLYTILQKLMLNAVSDTIEISQTALQGNNNKKLKVRLLSIFNFHTSGVKLMVKVAKVSIKINVSFI